MTGGTKNIRVQRYSSVAWKFDLLPLSLILGYTMNKLYIKQTRWFYRFLIIVLFKSIQNRWEVIAPSDEGLYPVGTTKESGEDMIVSLSLCNQTFERRFLLVSVSESGFPNIKMRCCLLNWRFLILHTLFIKLY